MVKSVLGEREPNMLGLEGTLLAVFLEESGVPSADPKFVALKKIASAVAAGAPPLETNNLMGSLGSCPASDKPRNIYGLTPFPGQDPRDVSYE